MTVSNTLARLSLLTLLLGCMLPPSAAADQVSVNPRQTWQMLEYIAVDYAGAVQEGQVRDAAEYAEMREFAGVVKAQLMQLPETPNQARLLAAGDRLIASVAAKAEPAQVASLARALADELLASYSLATVPSLPLDLDRAAQLYVQQCAGCHGVEGRGDGPTSASLDPRPIAFTDQVRAAERTPLALYEVISQGVPGTGMGSFAGLADNDRWALAFHVGGLAYSASSRREGAKFWPKAVRAHTRVPTLEALTRLREADLATTLPADQANAIVAYLRANPQAVLEPSGKSNPLALARQQLAASERAFGKGDYQGATTLALSAYLDGVEPIEPTLAARNPDLLREIEAAMGRFRALVGGHSSPEALNAQVSLMNMLFDRADAVVQDGQADPTAAFLGSFTILVREGLEALLIVIGIIAFLRKTEREDVLPYVHAGWLGALLAGGLTWAVATYVVDISGANREVTEGVSGLFAAAVLLSVGIWMHQKSVAGRWQQYLHAKLSAALTRRSAIFLFTLAFVAVYREVFETILFFIALWSEQSAGAMTAGLLAGIVVLVVVAYCMLRVSKRLPIGRFFSVSSWFIAVLAVVLVGKGVAALQEAGWVGLRFINMPRIEWLGVYPSWQSLLAQISVALAAVLGFYVNARVSRAPAP
ncbi:MAG: cytochrome c/FTR1 family iron permease [Xanthomonadales bacterium]|nr:cytochrome c/FTR1 family iron permease [Xanthomonadales bacterium]